MGTLNWTIAHGNDEDDYPVVKVDGQSPRPMYWVYSLVDGRTICYVPSLADAMHIVELAKGAR